MAKFLGVTISQLALTPFGGTVNLQTKILSSYHKCLIYLAGPLASLLLSMLFGVIVWLLPTIFAYLEYLVVANFLVGVINLLPIYPLDGGKVLSLYLSTKFVLIASNSFFSIILILNVIWFNWWWIFFAVVMLIQINWEFKQNTFYDKFSYAGRTKVGEFKQCAVLSSMSLWAVYRMIDKKRPTKFVVTDQQNIEFFESNLEQWLLKYKTNTELVRCLK
ncbi:MAG: site-2 protease family protein [Clostridia bacterium]|nr:site-2 protease family protein [Clostridia bacterium]